MSRLEDKFLNMRAQVSGSFDIFGTPRQGLYAAAWKRLHMYAVQCEERTFINSFAPEDMGSHYWTHRCRDTFVPGYWRFLWTPWGRMFELKFPKLEEAQVIAAEAGPHVSVTLEVDGYVHSRGRGGCHTASGVRLAAVGGGGGRGRGHPTV
jgi:hypothetical protein